MLKASAVLALCKFMCVSAEFCEKHLSLLFTLAERSKEAEIRANVVIAMVPQEDDMEEKLLCMFTQEFLSLRVISRYVSRILLSHGLRICMRDCAIRMSASQRTLCSFSPISF